MREKSRGREAALKALYRLDILGTGSATTTDDLLQEAVDDLKVGKRSEAFARTLLEEVIGAMDSIDSLIEEASENWRLDRMSVIDRNVLRLAVGELRSKEGTPFKVVIDEAIKLTKKYDSPESSAFVNGILDRVVKMLELDK